MISAPTVLIIDDDEDDVDLFKEALSEINRGIICISKSNGKVGLEYLKNSGKSLPQFIFLDLNMPFIDGKQFLKEVGKIERLAAIPVIIYTTSRQKWMRKKHESWELLILLPNLPALRNCAGCLNYA
jgi:CheY-like chemotaxis protein